MLAPRLPLLLFWSTEFWNMPAEAQDSVFKVLVLFDGG